MGLRAEGREKEISLLAGDFNVTLLDFKQNKKVQTFINLMFQFGLVSTSNKPTRITKDKNSAIHQILSSSVIKFYTK